MSNQLSELVKSHVDRLSADDKVIVLGVLSRATAAQLKSLNELDTRYLANALQGIAFNTVRLQSYNGYNESRMLPEWFTSVSGHDKGLRVGFTKPQPSRRREAKDNHPPQLVAIDPVNLSDKEAAELRDWCFDNGFSADTFAAEAKSLSEDKVGKYAIECKEAISNFVHLVQTLKRNPIYADAVAEGATLEGVIANIEACDSKPIFGVAMRYGSKVKQFVNRTMIAKGKQPVFLEPQPEAFEENERVAAETESVKETVAALVHSVEAAVEAMVAEAEAKVEAETKVVAAAPSKSAAPKQRK